MRNDFKYIHIKWSKLTCCDTKMGVQIDKETKEKSHYCYECETRLTPSQVAYHKALDYIAILENRIIFDNKNRNVDIMIKEFRERANYDIELEEE